VGFLEDVLQDQQPAPDVEAALRSRRAQIERVPAGRWKFGEPRFYYGGTPGKKTLIEAAFDFDLVMYLPPGAAEPRALVAAAERRLQEDSTRQTSIRPHIEKVRCSGNCGIIRLLKLWKCRHRVPVNSFVLERAAERALRCFEQWSLGERLDRVFWFLRDSFLEAHLVNPGNSSKRGYRRPELRTETAGQRGGRKGMREKGLFRRSMVTPSGREPLNRLSLLAFHVRIGRKFGIVAGDLTEKVSASATAAKNYLGGFTGQFHLGSYIFFLHVVLFLSADGAFGLDNQSRRLGELPKYLNAGILFADITGLTAPRKWVDAARIG